MKIRETDYSDQEINKVYQLLQHQLSTVPGSRYEIMVDDFPIVHKTVDIEQFKTFAEFIYSDTKTVTISFYDALGKIMSRNILWFKNGKQATENQEKGLGSIPEGMSAVEWREKQKQELVKEMEHEKRLSEIESLNQIINEQKKTIVDLTKQVEATKKEKNAPAAFLGSMLIDGVLKHPKVSGFLKDTSLSGIMGEDESKESEEEEEDENAAVSVKPKRSGVQDENVVDVETLTKEEIAILTYFKNSFSTLDEQEQDSLRYIISTLSKNPHAIGSVIKNLQNFLKQKPKQTDEKV